MHPVATSTMRPVPPTATAARPSTGTVRSSAQPTLTGRVTETLVTRIMRENPQARDAACIALAVAPVVIIPWGIYLAISPAQPAPLDPASARLVIGVQSAELAHARDVQVNNAVVALSFIPSIIFLVHCAFRYFCPATLTPAVPLTPVPVAHDPDLEAGLPYGAG